MTATRMAIAYAWRISPWELRAVPLAELAAMAAHLERLNATR